MTSELAILIKATVALALGLIAVQLGSRARASVRHLVLASTLTVVLALPLVSATVPALTLAVPMPDRIARSVDNPAVRMPATGGIATAAVPTTSPAANADRARTLPSLATLLRGVWALGTIILLGVLTRALWKVARIRRTAIPWLAGQSAADRLAGARRSPVSVVVHEDVPAPVTCGWRHPVIVFPSDAQQWKRDDLERALVHELEHVRRSDWIVQLAARGICAAYWFHPLVWVAWRRLGLECERACDDAVLDRMADTEYAEQLVALAGRLAQSDLQPVLSMARRSDLSVRVKAVLDQTQLRGRAGTSAVAAALAVTAVLALVLAPMRVQAVPAAVAEEEGQSRSRGGDSYRGASRGTVLGHALVEAVNEGSIEGVAALIDAGADVNAVVPGDGTALLIAARQGDRQMVEFLLQRGADTNIGVSGDGTALIMAARQGHATIVRTLLDRGADVNVAVEGDGNPLIMAARSGHLQVVQLLLDSGAIVDEVVPGDENAIISASEAGHLGVVRLLVSRGANVNARVWVERGRPVARGEWRTPLSQARRQGHTDVVRYLLSMGATD